MKKFLALMFAALLMMSATTSAKTIQATGYGMGPDGSDPKSSFYKTYARQAARLDAMRKLAEDISGINVNSDPEDETVIISSSSSRILKTKKVRQVGEAKFDENGDCEVTLEVDI